MALGRGESLIQSFYDDGGSGGSGSTTDLQTAYDNGVGTGKNGDVTLDKGYGIFLLDPDDGSVHDLFQVSDVVGDKLYFDISNNSTQRIRSGIADGAGAVGTSIDSINDLATADADVLRVGSGTAGGGKRFAVRKATTQVYASTGKAKFEMNNANSRQALANDCALMWATLDDLNGGGVAFDVNIQRSAASTFTLYTTNGTVETLTATKSTTDERTALKVQYQTGGVSQIGFVTRDAATGVLSIP